MGLIRIKSRVKGKQGYVNCARGSYYGNPFPLNRYSRERTLLNYEKYLRWRLEWDTVFADELHELFLRSEHEEVLLGCTCKETDSCHVDILIAIINELYG